MIIRPARLRSPLREKRRFHTTAKRSQLPIPQPVLLWTHEVIQRVIAGYTNSLKTKCRAVVADANGDPDRSNARRSWSSSLHLSETKRRETVRPRLIKHGVAYLRLQLAAEENLDARERLSRAGAPIH